MRRGQLVDLWAKCQRRVIDGVTDYDQRQKKDYMEIFKKKHRLTTCRIKLLLEMMK